MSRPSRKQWTSRASGFTGSPATLPAVTPSRSRATGGLHSDGTARTRSTSIWRTIMASKILRHPDIRPSHPGELLREVVIPATGLSKTAIAGLLGISRQSLYDILFERQ